MNKQVAYSKKKEGKSKTLKKILPLEKTLK